MRDDVPSLGYKSMFMKEPLAVTDEPTMLKIDFPTDVVQTFTFKIQASSGGPQA